MQYFQSHVLEASLPTAPHTIPPVHGRLRNVNRHASYHLEKIIRLSKINGWIMSGDTAVASFYGRIVTPRPPYAELRSAPILRDRRDSLDGTGLR